ncbi:DUF6344 domain-containing protein, partial [Streptomyces sp. YS-3]|uniref:DUF6344 domain-containing protein n=1 Tax=Streptomyces sp. YS-3 TaxID=3381352 RepID=UPI0038627D04
MATSKLTTWWTALIGALVALLAFFGLTGQAAAAASVPQQGAPRHLSEAAAPETPNVRWALPSASALPPTMKQRIRAEAHGSSPSSRHLPGAHDENDGGDGAQATAPDDTTEEPAGDGVAPPNVRWALPSASALPPTMKQRIRAEAHGSSPSSRHLPGAHDENDGGDGAQATAPDDTTEEPAGDGVA